MAHQICVVGTVATNPRLIKTDSDITFCTFRVASNERRYDREKREWIDGDTSWYTINTFRRLAEHARDSFAKGDRVIVNGRLRVRDWTSESRSGTSAEVEADALGHDLRWGVSAFTKRSGGDPTAFDVGADRGGAEHVGVDRGDAEQVGADRGDAGPAEDREDDRGAAPDAFPGPGVFGDDTISPPNGFGSTTEAAS